MTNKDIFKFWIIYPGICGIFAGIGHFIAYYSSIYLMR